MLMFQLKNKIFNQTHEKHLDQEQYKEEEYSFQSLGFERFKVNFFQKCNAAKRAG